MFYVHGERLYVERQAGLLQVLPSPSRNLAGLCVEIIRNHERRMHLLVHLDLWDTQNVANESTRLFSESRATCVKVH